MKKSIVLLLVALMNHASAAEIDLSKFGCFGLTPAIKKVDLKQVNVRTLSARGSDGTTFTVNTDSADATPLLHVHIEGKASMMFSKPAEACASGCVLSLPDGTQLGCFPKP